MTSRFPLAPWLFGLAAATVLVGCPGGSTADIRFKQEFHFNGKSDDSFGVPGGVPIEIWGMVGGTFRTVDVKNRGGGLLQGVEVPEGKLYFRNGGRWIVTDAREVVWHQHVWGRKDQADTPQGTLVETAMTGLAPWSREEGALHQLNVWASGNGYAFPVDNQAIDANAESATVTLRDLKFETDGLNAYLPALNGAAGDSLHLAQVLATHLTDASETVAFEDSWSVAVLRGAILKDGLALPDGVRPGEPQLSLSATLTPGNLRELEVDLRGNGFDEVVASADGALSGEHAVTRILIRPDLLGGLARTEAGSLPFALSASARTPEPGAPTARLTWSDAATAGPALHVAYGRMYLSQGLQVEAGTVTALDPAATTLDVAPLVGAPGVIHLDNAPITEGMNVTSPSPLVSWSAPSVGTAHGYEVRIVRRNATGEIRSEALLTRETQVRLPPAFLSQDAEKTFTFAIVVTALHDAAEGFPETRQQPKVPFGYAARGTAFFTSGQQ